MQKPHLFHNHVGFYVEIYLYVYIQVLRSIGLHEGQHIKKLIVQQVF